MLASWQKEEERNDLEHFKLKAKQIRHDYRYPRSCC